MVKKKQDALMKLPRS